MFALHLVFLAFLAISRGQSGIPQYIQGGWTIADENPQYDDVTEEQSPAVEVNMWPESSPAVTELVIEQQDLSTTPEPHFIKEQEDCDKGQDSAVWKIALVVAVLLVSVVGSLSMAYYLCVWRGGRIHYQPQKADYT